MTSTSVRSGIKLKNPPIHRARTNLEESEEILRKLTESLGMRAAHPGVDVSKATPNELLDYLIEKFHNLINQLKQEEKARLKAEYEVYELKKTLQRELLKQEETLKFSQAEIQKLQISEKAAPPSVFSNEEIQKMTDELERKESIITAMDDRMLKINNELEHERSKNLELNEALQTLKRSLNHKENDATLSTKRVEDLLEKKNKLQSECGMLREEMKKINTTLSQKDSHCEMLRNQMAKIQEDSRMKVEELRVSLRKNSNLLKQVSDLERENKRLNEMVVSMNERMNAIRKTNKILETKSDDIKKKCEDLLFLQEKCEQLEAKNEELAKMLQISELEKIKQSCPDSFEEELSKKNLEIAKLRQELEMLHANTRRPDQKEDQISAIGTVRKDKELRALQNENEVLKLENERLNQIMARTDRSQPEPPPKISDTYYRDVFDEGNEEEKEEPHMNFKKSLGSDTLKSSLSDLTKSQKLLIENMTDEQLLNLQPQSFDIEQSKTYSYL